MYISSSASSSSSLFSISWRNQTSVQIRKTRNTYGTFNLLSFQHLFILINGICECSVYNSRKTSKHLCRNIRLGIWWRTYTTSTAYWCNLPSQVIISLNNTWCTIKFDILCLFDIERGQQNWSSTLVSNLVSSIIQASCLMSLPICYIISLSHFKCVWLYIGYEANVCDADAKATQKNKSISLTANCVYVKWHTEKSYVDTYFT